MYCVQMNQITACLSQEQHLAGGQRAFSVSEQHVQHARCIADHLQTNKAKHPLSEVPLEMVVSLLTRTQVEKFVWICVPVWGSRLLSQKAASVV